MQNLGQMKQIGVAIAGLGFGENVHLPALNSNPNLIPTALWHPRQSRLEEAVQKNNIKGYIDWNDLLKDEDVEAIIIATPPFNRYDLALNAIEAGKHLLLEKPVCINSNQIENLQRKAIDKGLIIAVDFEYRYVPTFMQAKRMIDQGFIGKPWLVKFDWLMSSRANPERKWDWYSDAEKGGGVLGALGTHAFDILHWLLGASINVSGNLKTSIKDRKDPSTNKQKTVTSEDIVLAQIEMASDQNNSTFPAQVSLSAVTRLGRGCWLEIYGSEGTLIIGSDNQKDYVHGFGLWAAKANESSRLISLDSDLIFNSTWSDGRIAPIARLQRKWSECISAGKPMTPGLMEGLASQKVCDAIRLSTESNQKINI